MPTLSTRLCSSSWLFALTILACSSDDGKDSSTAPATGGTGTLTSGGTAGIGGNVVGATSSGGSTVGGLGGSSSTAATGGAATGGTIATGGAAPSGGTDAGTPTGGRSATGGAAATGGVAAGGALQTGDGGGSPAGGAAGMGGVAATGGATALGGASSSSDTGGVGIGGGAGVTGVGSTGGDGVGGQSGLGGAGVGGAAGGGVATGGSDPGGASAGGAEIGGGAGTGTAGAGDVLVGCIPGTLDATATCNTPDFRSGAPGDEVECVGSLDGPWGSIYATIDGQQYFLQINEWGSTQSQVMDHGGDYFFRMVTQTATTGTHGADAPTGYPSMFIGANNGHATTDSNLPKPISEITSVPTTWIWNDNGALADTENSIFNAAYDVWFNRSPTETTQYSPTGGFLMVWLYDPPYAEPIGGEPAFTGVAIDGVDGTWDIWIGLNGTTPCISYVRTEMTLELSFDLKHFIDDAVTREGGLDASWSLTNIFTGFEIWQGAQDVETTAFCAFVE